MNAAFTPLIPAGLASRRRATGRSAVAAATGAIPLTTGHRPGVALVQREWATLGSATFRRM